MPETGACQKDLGSAIAQLEIIKKMLLEVFEWSSQIGMYTNRERSDALMKIYTARISFPVVDISLRNFCKQFGADPGYCITWIHDSCTERAERAQGSPKSPTVDETGTQIEKVLGEEKSGN